MDCNQIPCMEKKPKRSKKKLDRYPHYPDNQDITRAHNNNGRLRIDENDVDINTDAASAANRNDTMDDRDEEVSFVPGTDADVTHEDLRMLEAAEQNMDTPDSRNLMGSSLDYTDSDGDPLNVDSSLDEDMTGEDLDVPGRGADNANEDIGEEDEENNYYSLGGDLHESQEENKGE